MRIKDSIKIVFCSILFSFLFGFLIESQLVAEGFFHGTQVKTPMGYVAIEELQINDSVMCCDNEWSLREQPISALYQKRVTHYMKILVNNESIYAAADQKFYVLKKEIWCEAQALMPGDFLLSNCENLIVVDDVIFIDQEATLYDITVDGYHNFCISSRDIHVHNVIPVIAAGFSWVVGLGAVEITQATLAVVGTAIAFVVSRNDKQKAKTSTSSGLGGQNNNGGPSDDDDPDDKKQQRDDARNNHRPLTNKQARQKAQELGYKEDKNPPFDTHKKPAFRNGNDWISPDRDGHNGGVWKRFTKGYRDGTYNIDLTKKIGT